MGHSSEFADVLQKYMKLAGYGADRLSQSSGVPKQTIINWRKGHKPREWQSLARVARALNLNEEQATTLLQAAGHPSVRELLAGVHQEEDSALLASWVTTSSSTITIASAHEVLAALPLDHIAAPAPLPAGSRMPLTRNPLFVGRVTHLRTLAHMLKGSATDVHADAITVAITGIAGIGKTQLASEFVHRYGQYFAGGVFWLSLADASAVPAEVASCGDVDCLNLRPDFGSLSLDDRVRLVRAAWASPTPRLLVFDNCEDEALLANWRPTSGGCRVLVTSRRARWDMALGVQVIALDVLDRADSVALLCKHRPDLAPDAPDLAAIADKVGNLPLALHLAGTFLNRYSYVVTPADYLAQLRSTAPLAHRSFQGGGVSPTRHVQHIERSFALSYVRLSADDPTDSIALALLARAAYFAPGELIPRDLLAATFVQAEHASDMTLMIEDALVRLITLGFLEPGAAGALRMHRLVVAFVRKQTSDVTAQGAVEAALLATVKHLNENSRIGPVLALQPHLRFVTNAAIQQGNESAANLCRALGYHLWLINGFDEARMYLEHALRIDEQQPEKNELMIAEDLSLLALLFHIKGMYTEARPLFERTLAIQQRLLGDEHPETATAHNNLGYFLFVQGDYATAAFHLNRGLKIRRRTLKRNDSDIARSLRNVGYMLFSRGYYASAQRYSRAALAIFEAALEPNPIAIAQVLNNLGDIMVAQQRYSEALVYHQRAFDIRTALFGEVHEDIAESLYNIGQVLTAQRNYNKARLALDQAFTISKKVFGEDHLQVSFVLTHLGRLFREQCDYQAAQSYFEQALTIMERVLGKNHSYIAAILDDLGVLLHLRGDLNNAHSYLEQALALRNSVVGETHPETMLSLAHLGLVLKSQGECTQAQMYIDRAIRLCTKRYGAEHTITRGIQAAIATVAG